MRELHGKVALVTGGGTGIGRAICLALADAGADVLVHYRRSKEDAELVAKLVAEQGLRSHAIQCDLADRTALADFAEAADDHWGKVDFLVNNAGRAERAVDKVTTDADFLGHLDGWDKVMDVNLRAPIELTSRFARKMRGRGGGHIVNIASVAGFYAWTDAPFYSLSKAGLLHFTRQAAQVYAPKVAVNAVAPGWIETDFGGGIIRDEGFQKEVSQDIPQRRVGEPEDVAKAVLYLLKDAPYTTGTTLTVDGGMVAECR